MERNSVLYQQYTGILREELVPAMGCTEPISIAYAAAKCRALLGCEPERCVLEVSSSIIKNVKSVIVPNTGGRKGIETAVAAGIVGGDETAQLQVLAHMQPAQIDRIEDYLKATPSLVTHAQNGIMFYIDITVWGKGHTARLAISHHHTNIIRIEKDGCVLLDKTEDASAQNTSADRSVLSVEGIWDYVNSVALEDVSDAISRQIEYNSALAKEGLTNRWGAQIGRITQQQSNGDVRMLARAAAAAGSDARMNGCELPAVILSGSGNQGITATMPVLVYAEHLGSTHEQLYRALVLSDLVTIHQNGDRQRFRVLRSGLRRRWRRVRHCLPSGSGLRCNLPYHCKCACNPFRNALRWRQIFLCRQNFGSGGCRHHGIHHVCKRPAVLWRRRHC